LEHKGLVMGEHQIWLAILAGGLFGVILGKFMDAAPSWVFWLVVALFFIIVVFVLTTA